MDFALRPNWSEGVRVSWEFSTEIFESRSGREQRRALRTIPREAVEFVLRENGEARRQVFATLGNFAGVVGTISDFRTGEAIEGTLATSLEGTLHTSDLADVTVNFSLIPKASRYQSLPQYLIFEGREVFGIDPNFADSPSLTFDQVVERVDFGGNRWTERQLFANASRLVSADWLAIGEEEVTEISDFFIRHYGSAREFFVPLYEDAFEIVGPGPRAGSQTLDISMAGKGGNNFHPAICLWMKDGRRIFRTVVSTEKVGSVDRITLDKQWLYDEAENRVRRACWLAMARNEGDNLTAEYVTDRVATYSLSFRTLAYEEADAPLPFYTEEARAVLETWDYPDIAHALSRFDDGMNFFLPTGLSPTVYDELMKYARAIDTGLNYNWPARFPA